MLVLVRRRSVVMIRVIVPDVLVHMQRRRHGPRNDQGLGKHEGHETAHGHQSTTRPDRNCPTGSSRDRPLSALTAADVNRRREKRRSSQPKSTGRGSHGSQRWLDGHRPLAGVREGKEANSFSGSPLLLLVFSLLRSPLIPQETSLGNEDLLSARSDLPFSVRMREYRVQRGGAL